VLLCAPLVPVYVTVPLIAELPFMNCTVPGFVTPDPHGASPLLFVETVAVSVTLPPDAMLVGLAVTAAVVAACVIVTLSPVEVFAL
jgi:hypothetical protein